MESLINNAQSPVWGACEPNLRGASSHLLNYYVVTGNGWPWFVYPK